MGYLPDCRRLWQRTFDGVESMPSVVDVGTRLHEQHHYGWGLEQLGEIRLDPAERGTMLTAYVEARSTSKLASLSSNWSIRAGRRRVDRDFRRLKSLAEAEATTSRNDPRPDGAGDGH